MGLACSCDDEECKSEQLYTSNGYLPTAIRGMIAEYENNGVREIKLRDSPNF